MRTASAGLGPQQSSAPSVTTRSRRPPGLGRRGHRAHGQQGAPELGRGAPGLACPDPGGHSPARRREPGRAPARGDHAAQLLVYCL
eukprot:14500229-Alexandrium_andersonii.AAC.1